MQILSFAKPPAKWHFRNEYNHGDIFTLMRDHTEYSVCIDATGSGYVTMYYAPPNITFARYECYFTYNGCGWYIVPTMDQRFELRDGARWKPHATSDPVDIPLNAQLHIGDVVVDDGFVTVTVVCSHCVAKLRIETSILRYPQN